MVVVGHPQNDLLQELLIDNPLRGFWCPIGTKHRTGASTVCSCVSVAQLRTPPLGTNTSSTVTSPRGTDRRRGETGESGAAED